MESIELFLNMTDVTSRCSDGKDFYIGRQVSAVIIVSGTKT